MTTTSDSAAERLLTPSKITAWLDCAHYLTLQHQIETGARSKSTQPFGAFAQLLVDKGHAHEADCLAQFAAMGVTVLHVPDRERGEPFQAWVDRVGNLLTSDVDVVYQMPFVHQGVRGIADFLIRVTDAESGIDHWEPVDAKLARTAAKPGHVLQLCFYADAVEALTGNAPTNLHVWLGSGEFESIRASDVRPYWNRLRSQLARLLDGEPSDTPTSPEPCNHCQFCEFDALCESEWRAADSLVFVAGARRVERALLESNGVSTVGELADVLVAHDVVDGLDPDQLSRLVEQAALQVEARLHPDDLPPFRVVERGEHPTWGRGFEAMPEPATGDVYLDFEGHPFWRADTGLFFLLGLIAQEADGEWRYHAWWAHDQDSEAIATRELVEWLVARRATFPPMHVYHYNHTERSSLQSLAATHGVVQSELAELVDSGLFVDLYTVARNAVQVGTESYGLKHLERLAGFVRIEDIHGGAGAVVEYEAFMGDGVQSHLDHIAAYNEDDVRATLALHEWLTAHRPADLAWRPARVEADAAIPELDELVERLHSFAPGSSEHFLGDVMGYWLREWRAYKTPKIVKLANGGPKLLDDPEVVAGLTCRGQVSRVGTTGKELEGVGLEFTFEAQELTADLGPGTSLFYALPDGLSGYSGVNVLDRDERRLVVNWSEKSQDAGVIPAAVILDDYVHPGAKTERLNELGRSAVDPSINGARNPAVTALISRATPTFTAGCGPVDGRFTEDLDEMKELVRHLDHSYLAIQGPPGTGKTFRGAHIVHSLVAAGLRVGITAMSHHAIDNFLDEVVKIMSEEGDLGALRVARKVGKKRQAVPGITYVTDNGKCADPGFNVVAGTTWLFATDKMQGAPVDVLIIDEAGQLALADALAAMSSAHNVVLLGDPSQLAQVSKASHPNGSGASVLEHVLGDEPTITDERGIFLSETRRMHPDVCEFISSQIYEGKLRSHASCALQTTDEGTGLRWLRAEHEGCTTKSVEEADLVAAEISRLVGMGWTDETGTPRTLTVDDVMVVAPYNEQVKLMRAHLDADPTTSGVAVGTVDKFQGRQAAVVFFTMTTSTAADMPRGPEFLFSRNRLNVAISRAKCLAYLVCTEPLLDTRARDISDMRLISTLCAFVEAATLPPTP